MKCLICGIEFDKKQHNRLYCSKSCKWQARYARIVDATVKTTRPTLTRECLRCRKEFTTQMGCRRYCSDICYKKAKSCRNCKKRIPKFEGVCELCKAKFKTKGNRGQKFCSRKCAAISTGIKAKKFLDIPSCLVSASRKIDKNIGYVRIYAPMHPKANTWGYVYEHKIIAEQILGRSLNDDEVVHHKNGRRWDNSVQNLEVMNKIDHSRLKKCGPVAQR